MVELLSPLSVELSSVGPETAAPNAQFLLSFPSFLRHNPLLQLLVSCRFFRGYFITNFAITMHHNINLCFPEVLGDPYSGVVATHRLRTHALAYWVKYR